MNNYEKQLPMTDYDYVLKLVKEISDTIYNTFKILHWTVNVANERAYIQTDAGVTRNSLYSVKPKIDEYISIKFTVFEASYIDEDFWFSFNFDHNLIEYLARKSEEEKMLNDMLLNLINTLKENEFVLEYRHNFNSCLSAIDNTYAIEIRRM